MLLNKNVRENGDASSESLLHRTYDFELFLFLKSYMPIF